MLPLRHIGVPVAEMILTLMLSLRFINLVFDEVRAQQLSAICNNLLSCFLSESYDCDNEYCNTGS